MRVKDIERRVRECNKIINSKYDDIRKKCKVIVGEMVDANIDDRMAIALLLRNWNFFVSTSSMSKTDVFVSFVKVHLYTNKKLEKSDITRVTKILGMDVMPILKILRERNILVKIRRYTCPECDASMGDTSEFIECEVCGAEYDSKRDLDRELWYEKGPNFYPPAKKPAEPSPDTNVSWSPSLFDETPNVAVATFDDSTRVNEPSPDEVTIGGEIYPHIVEHCTDGALVKYECAKCHNVYEAYTSPSKVFCGNCVDAQSGLTSMDDDDLPLQIDGKLDDDNLGDD
jgi:hypothetical protein